MNRYIIAFLLISAGTASAQQQLSMSQKMELRDNCKQDIQQLCPGVQPGDGGIMACVKENKAKLSSMCSATIDKLLAAKK
ncbi:cysteine rich repeat-containing protein [Rhizobium sp. 16-449-1b]|uniref:cysteine rich repeat-containing protein n=1 Tax=Rhizobium sp. 16-449-1b TaxID=2819989 RepID=UPI00068A8E31|nr:cysteine rich repeat-containing protein [Rhizobium sp. 16-449-1b]MBO9196763.1 cysteine rich repeat-containing protein [Rhizobium sp. 16-449-1b]